MRTMFLILLLALFVAIPVNPAVYWVVETVAADNVGTVGLFADPFGIQQAFTTAGCTDEIRIVQGANDYDSGTASWTNRNADKSITVNVSCGASRPQWATCWQDATTQLTGVGDCMLDFSGGTGHGFVLSGFSHLFFGVGATGANTDGFRSTGGDALFFRCLATNNGSDGFDLAFGSSYSRVLQSLATGNGAVGIHCEGCTLLALNYVSGGTNGIECDPCSATISNIVESTSGIGIRAKSRGGSYLFNTVYGAGGNAIEQPGDNNAVYLYNILTGSSGAYGLQVNAGQWSPLVGDNNYYNNFSGARNILGTIVFDLDSTPDITAVTFAGAGAGDFEVTSGGDRIIDFPGGTTTDTGKQGAVQNAGGTGGGTVSYGVGQ